MNIKPMKLITAIILIMVVSCDEPETIVTNYVHPDGSITRKIEMRNIKNNFSKKDIQVPLDSTWSIKDTIEINQKGDTTYIRRAEKQFRNVDEINFAYKSDSGACKEASRSASFSKRFRWFNTEFRFSEKIDQKLTFGYPVKNFLNENELTYFYSPESLKSEKENGADSLKFRALSDSVKKKTDRWAYKNLVAGWIQEFARQTAARGETEITKESLTAREDEMARKVEKYGDKLDSLWKEGIILRELIGETKALKYKTEADSAISYAIDNYAINFKDYSVRIAMPGTLTGTNGFIDSSKVLLWPVKSDFFLTQPYEMWAESKIPNIWAWIVSGLFLLFVLTGVVIRINKKG
jgi:hypothetical protein